jgi:hypothetical protein
MMGRQDEAAQHFKSSASIATFPQSTCSGELMRSWT